MDQKKIIKIEVSKNYIIEDYKNPPNAISYVKKTIVDKDGFHNIATLAIVKDPETGDTKTVITSFWRPINKPSARRILKHFLKTNPSKVKFKSKDLKEKYLSESIIINRSLSSLFFEDIEVNL